MEIAHREDLRELPWRHRAEEAEAPEIRALGRDDVLAERLRLDVPEVVAVVDAVAADHDEQHVRHRRRDPVRRADEDVEPAHGLEAARDVRDVRDDAS